MQEQTPQIGPVTQDDPVVEGFGMDPRGDSEGQITFIAVFEDVTGAKACADNLERQGLEVAMLSRRGDGPEQGLRPGNVITGPGYGLSQEGHSQESAHHRLGSGVAVGATIGATAGLLAATYVIPGMGTLVATGSLISTLAGAGLGSFLGGLAEYTATDHQDDASVYAGTVRKGGVLLLVRADPDQSAQVRQLIEFWRPLEIRVQ